MPRVDSPQERTDRKVALVGTHTRGSGRVPRRDAVVLLALLGLAALAVIVAAASSNGERALAVTVSLGAVAAAGILVLTSLRSTESARRREAAERVDANERLQDLSTGVEARDSVLATIREGVALFDSDGRVAYANPALKELLGRRFETVHEVIPLAVRAAVQDVGAGADTVERELTVGDRIVQATAIPALPSGAVVLVVRDVTTARGVERLRRDFVANASHELKTPVASMVALSETMSGATSDPEAMRRFLARLQQEATRLASLVQDLLALSRLEEGIVSHERVHLRGVVGGEVERLRARATEANLKLIAVDIEDVVVEGTESDLSLMVHNLIDNAVRYTPSGGEVRVSLRRRERTAILEVGDTGVGIPSRDLDRVFERFYRVDPGRSRETGGTGLGLSIVRHVAESHGGRASAASVLGAGSTFRVEIPLAREAEQQPAS